MHNLAIITARGGSKRIPRKNIKEFCGKPILTYSIEAALKSGVFDEVMVSTDDSEIARIAIASGAAVPFMRSEATSNDYASTDDVIAEVLDMYKAAGKTFDSFCCIYPTAPFITPDRLAGAMTLLGEHESVMPVVAYSYPPQRSVVIRDGLIVRRFPEYLNSRSQDLEKFYHDCGQFYACRADAFRRGGTTDVDDLAPLVLDDAEVQDIDTLEDWAIAEEKFKRLHC
ncbi:MAG: pseudaminic acid cytidylyltransferase [Clostridiales bacterium]|jgi:N-acylneuraminate cytidylyltransferase|nr:pseudaminic acid cytidylyltransferase [Clostridiales bacterium]